MNKIQAWFWSPIRHEENSAQTVFRVLGNLARWGVTALLLGILILGVLITIEYSSNKKRKKLREMVQIVKIEQSSECTKEFPVRVVVGNLSGKTVEAFDVEIEARREGRSTNLLSYTNGTLEWDIIMPPGEGYALCYKFPSILEKYDLEEIVWSGKIREYSIKFRDE